MQTSRTSSKSSINGNNKLKKITNIAEILGLLDETHRSKDWLREVLKKHHVKLTVKLTSNSYEILQSCPEEFITKILQVLKGQDIEGFEDIKSLTKTYHWFFTDIVAGSNPTIPTKAQVKKIVVLNELISRTDVFQHRDPKSTVILPTGDGMAVGFSEFPEKPLRLAIELHKSLSRYNETKRGKEKLLIRVGIDMGPVYVIKDLNGLDNVWGPGIILTRRVMDLAGDMNIFASARIAEDIRKLSPEYKEILHSIGGYSIKHGEELLIYNIYGDGFGSKIYPRKGKVEKSTLEKEIKTTNNFALDTVDVLLEILDPKTKNTHHTVMWNVRNISKEAKDQIFYYLSGDTEKDFKDLNVVVTDDRGNRLNILSVNTNKPYYKTFTVQLHRPILPKQNKTLKLQYDWEEPDSTFGYQVPTDCKRFSYTCIIPKELDVKNRILKVEPDTGLKILATPPATVKYLTDKTSISWSKTNLKAHDSYEFGW